jgi:signal transduction histidine kinase
MKKYIVVYALLTTAILLFFFVSIRQDNAPNSQAVDTTEVNRIVQHISSSWENIELLEHVDFLYSFFIVDSDGQVIYATTGNLPTNTQAAIRQGFLPMNIFINGQNNGTVLIETIERDERTYVRLFPVVITFVLLFFLNATFLVLVYMAVVKPFRRIQRFTHKISIGILDDSLSFSKSNLFGDFTQCFDIMRASLFEARQKQLVAERAKKELIASLSHDVKTPVTSIKLIAELLQAKIKDQNNRKKLEVIETKANQINRLMNDMLHSTMEELGELQVTVSSEDSSILGNLFKNSDYLTRVKLNPIPSCLIEIDAIRMEHVIDNIIINSYKYANTNIDVDFTIQDKGLQIDIRDYGDGVEMEELELITTKFYRGTNAKALQKEGEGLGLFVSKDLIDKMGGGLEAHNHSNGFVIRIWVKLSLLPLLRVES